jgi:hypothetical protein
MDSSRIGDVEKLFVERREWPRAAIDKIVEKAVVRLSAGSTQAPAVELVNLSEAGAGILLPMPVERGLHLTLELASKDFPLLGVPAEIRWAGKQPVSTGQYAAGIKFMPLDAQKQARLRTLLQALRMHKKSAS